MKRYIIGIDEGTTSTRAGIYDVKTNKIIAIVQKPISLIYPKSGWVEQDANEILNKQLDCISEVVKKSRINIGDIISIGITNQRETVVAWDKKTGKPLANTICWQCRRTANIINKLTDKQKKIIKQKTGLIPDAYFSGAKIEWLLKNNKKVRDAYAKKSLLIGNVDTFLAYNLTGKYVTDDTNASRTMLYNIHTCKWDGDLLKMFHIPENILPEIISSNTIVGETNFLGSPIQVCGIIGDQQSALFGQCCFSDGMAKNTYGTGSFLLVNIGDKPELIDNLLTDVAYSIDGKITYAIEGSVFNSGSSVQWIRDNLGICKKSADTEQMAKSVEDTGGVFFIPAFTGLGAPYWDMNARAGFVGITRGTNKNHIARAVLESMAFRTEDLLVEIRKIRKIKELRCDGGASNNGFLMQFQSDVSNIKISLPKSFESTLMGAIYMSALGTKTFKDLNEIKQLWQKNIEYSPFQSKTCKKTYQAWQNAVKKVIQN